MTFVRPNVESLLRQISRASFASSQTQAKPIDRGSKVSQDFQTPGRRTCRRYLKMGVLSRAFVPANTQKVAT